MTLPWCSTVTLWAMSSTKPMSCSITSTERSLDDAVQQLGRLLALADAHAGDGLVEHEQRRVLDQQHADLEPLLLAVAQILGVVVEMVLEEDVAGDLLDPLADGGVALEGERAEHGAAARVGDLQVLEHGEVFVDRRRLELAADAGADDLVLLHLGQLAALERDGAAGRLGPAADEVEHRGLAGAVGPDDDADLVAVEIEGEIVDRAEAVERDGQPFDGEEKVGPGHSCRLPARAHAALRRSRWSAGAPLASA